MRPNNYKKFVYWLPIEEFNRFRAQFEQETHKSIFVPERYPCEVLSPARPLGVVLPETWNKSCNRQGSWYRTSAKAGLVILVSAKFLPKLKKHFWGQVSVVAFTPPRLPTPQDVQDLVKTTAYTSRAPEEWPKFTDDEKVKYRRYFDSHGISLSLEEVMMHQSANHANFLQIDPPFATHGDHVPYSLFPITLTCCACMEIFGVIGTVHLKKFVMKCPGLKFVDLAQGEYFLVESVSNYI